MLFFLVPAIVGVGVMTAAIALMPDTNNVAEQAAAAQLTQYRTFLFTAKTYFDKTAAPASTTAYGWSTLRTAATPTHMNAGIPPHWKAVRRADGYWVACTQLGEKATAKLPALFPAQAVLSTVVPNSSITLVVGTGGASPGTGSPTYVVVGDQTAAATSANLCAGT
jgi:hypothetical protein